METPDSSRRSSRIRGKRSESRGKTDTTSPNRSTSSSTHNSSNSTSTPTKHPFIPATQFFEDFDRLTSDYFSGSDTPSRLRESTRRLSIRKPFNPYIAYSSDEEFADWKLQPKTNYTYSETSSYRSRVTPERRVGSPNLSRRDLHKSSAFKDSEDFHDHSIEIGDSSLGTLLKSRNLRVKQDALDAFSDFSEEESEPITTTTSNMEKKTRKETVSSFRRITRSSRAITTTHTVPLGLGAESDNEGPDPLPHRATPIVARQATSSLLTQGYKSYGENNQYKQETETWSTKVMRVLSTFCTTIILSIVQISSVFTSNKTYTNKDSVNNNNEIREKTVTKTWWTRVKRRVTTTTEWYSDKKGTNPFLWCYLPLVFLLLLALIGAYWMLLAADSTESDEPGMLLSLSQSTSAIASSVSSSIVSASNIASSTLSSGSDYLSSGIVTGSTIISDAFVNFWTSGFTGLSVSLVYVKDLLISSAFFIYQCILSACNFIYNFFLILLGYLNDFYLYAIGLFAGLFEDNSESIPSEEKSDSLVLEGVESESVVENDSSVSDWLVAYSPLPLIASVSDNVSSFIVSSTTSTYKGVLYYGDKISSSVYDGILYSGESVWNTWVETTAGIGGIISGGFKLTEDIVLNSYKVISYPVVVGYSFVSSTLGNVFTNILYGFAYFGHSISQFIFYIYDLIVWLLSSLTTAVCFIPELVSSTAVSTGAMFYTAYSSSINAINNALPTFSSEPSAPIIDAPVDPPPNIVKTPSFNIDEVVAKVLASSELQALHTSQTTDSQQQIGELKSYILLELAKLKTRVDDMEKTNIEENSNIVKETALIKENIVKLGSSLELVEAATEAEVQRVAEVRDSIDEIKSNMDELSGSLGLLQKNHENLAAEIRTCCQDGKVTMADVEKLVHSMVGGLGADSSDKNPDIHAWVGSLLAAKEINKKLGSMYDRFVEGGDSKDQGTTKGDQGTLDETTKEIVGTIFSRIDQEVSSKYAQNSNELSAYIKDQINKSTEELKESGTAEVKGTVETSVTENIQQMMPEALQKMLPAIVSKHVDEAVAQSTSALVNDVVGRVLNLTMAEVKEGEMKHLLEINIKEAVDKQIEVMHEEIKSSFETNQVNVEPEVTARVDLSQNMSSAYLNVDLVKSLDEDHVKKIVKEMLMQYDADKTGMPDYALEGAGGSIVSKGCSETYMGVYQESKLLGYSFFQKATTEPKFAIQPMSSPGHCWAFSGAQGYLIIKLATIIKPTGFTMEHLPKRLHLKGNINSAPKNFTVSASNEESGENKILIGQYSYLDNGEALQYFPVDNNDDTYYQYIHLDITSNHGNIQYTCLYRFRVHGIPQEGS